MYICLGYLKLFSRYSCNWNREKAQGLAAGGSGIYHPAPWGALCWQSIVLFSWQRRRHHQCLLVRVLSRKAPVWAKVPNSVPCISGKKRLFQGSQWCNVSLCFEPIPKVRVASSNLETGGFTWHYSKETNLLFWSDSETPSFTSDRSLIALVLQIWVT